MYDIFFISYKGYSDITWNKVKDRFPHAKRIYQVDTIESAYAECAKKAFTRMFWTIDEGIIIKDDWNFEFSPTKWDKKYIHVWNSINSITGETYGYGSSRGSIKLWPKELFLTFSVSELLQSSGHIKEIDKVTSFSEKHDIFFVSYEEDEADKNWNLLIQRFPNAKRVHGIKGIGNAHRHCASQATTSMFWTIDAETLVDESWDFSYDPLVWDKGYIHLWYSRNPINGLEYGYGGIKLWPTTKVLDYDGNWLDFTTSVSDMKIIPKTISTTAFNTSPYSTWKSAFRECVKLNNNIDNNEDDIESKERLLVWQSTMNTIEPYSDWALNGANDGIEWYSDSKDRVIAINDFEWLKTAFFNLYPNKVL